ncbi:MAG: T9SS type A sorting domain-containing protein [Bacteroidota bacterium]
MTRTVLYSFLLFLFPLHMMAQYGGGDGRGEITSVGNANQLNGVMLNIYGGGNGRGETDSIVNAVQLNGINLNLYGGGNGRGETDSTINAAQLNGVILNIYGGGNGRGETDSLVSAVQLDGHLLTIYGGGDGRGETDSAINSIQLNGVSLDIYSGGNGRGESQLNVNTLQLDGTVENSMFMGGGGRGESSQQFNTIALPVTLMSFGAAAAGNQVKVQWQTATELNSSFFTVEKSLDGNSWQSIGKVNAAGHSDVPLSYQLLDTHPVEGINYYRLRSEDIDGKFSYSGVVTVHYSTGNNTKIIVYPNPVTYQFTVAVQGLQTMARLHISLVNAQGKTIFNSQNLSGNTQTFNISNLAAGIYYLVINNNGEVSTTKIVKE